MPPTKSTAQYRTHQSMSLQKNDSLDSLENSHRTATAATRRANEQNQAACHDQQEAECEWRKLDIEMNVIAPTGPASFDAAAWLNFGFSFLSL